MTANLFLRKNGSFGASCDGCADTGHHITEDSGFYTVYDHDDELLISNASREAAEAAIAHDWRNAGRASLPASCIDETALTYAKNAFVTEGASLTIRNGKVTGRENFDARMRAAISTYLEHAKGGDA